MNYKLVSSTVNISLPNLQLLTSSGFPTKWTPYWVLFNASIYNNRELPNVQKLSYLKGQLEGQAKILVEGFKLESINYHQCADLLETTYAKSDVVKASHIQNLIALTYELNV